MEVKASAKYIRISPQKVHVVLGAIKGKPVDTALNTLKFMPQKAAGILEKVIRSAVANADQLLLEASPTRRAMTMAGKRTPRVDRKVASILAGVFTA